MIRQLDIWVLDCYLDEAGWDGERQQLYFRRKQDAEFFGEQLEQLVKRARRRAAHRDKYLDWKVYKLNPYVSFYSLEDKRMPEVEAIANEWLEV